MSGFSKKKSLLLGLLMASPVMAVWKFRDSHITDSRPEDRHISNSQGLDSVVRIPVEIIATGSDPEWVYIEVASQTLPKPGSDQESR